MIQSFNKKIAILLVGIPTLLGAIGATIILLNRPKTIKVGILHSLTGELAKEEQDAIHGTLSAIDEINLTGGILGRKVEPILANGASLPTQFAQEAENLIVKEHVAAIFGCWSSASRKKVKPVIEKYNNLLFFPKEFEGLETSPNIIYSGLTGNQFLIPSLIWATSKFGRNVYLIGTDFIISHACHEIIKVFAKKNGINIVGEFFAQRAASSIDPAIEDIKKTSPNLIFNTMYGDANIPFFKKLYAEKISSEIIPIISTSVSRKLIEEIGIKYFSGHFLVRSYLESIASETNKSLITIVKKKYGANRRISNALQTAYTNVHLWATGVKGAHSTTDIKKIKDSMTARSFASPAGPILIDPETLYKWQTPLIIKILNDGEGLLVWQSKDPLKPEPYPKFSSKKYWEDFLIRKFNEWGQQWGKVLE